MEPNHQTILFDDDYYCDDDDDVVDDDDDHDDDVVDDDDNIWNSCTRSYQQHVHLPTLVHGPDVHGGPPPAAACGAGRLGRVAFGQEFADSGKAVFSQQ